MTEWTIKCNHHWAIYVDGKYMTKCNSKADAEELLELVLIEYQRMGVKYEIH